MSNKILIVLIGAFLLVVVAMGGGFFMMWNKMSSMNVAKNEKVESESEVEEKVSHEMGPTKKLESFVVNLADEGGTRYLRVSMDLELETKETAQVVDKMLPKIRDAILMILPTKKYEDIGTIEGKSSLRKEMLLKINELMVPENIKNIYFTEFVVQ